MVMAHAIIMFFFYSFTTKKTTTTPSSPSSYSLLLRKGCKPTLLSSSYGLVLFCRHEKKGQTIALLVLIVGWFCRNKKMMTGNTIPSCHFGVALQTNKNNDEQLCCSFSLLCGFTKVKK
jgi:hypothetical protein